MIDLSERVALVTGASRGIGRAIAHRLAKQGAHVVAAARGANAQPVADEITSAGGRAEALTLDVTEPGAADDAVKQVMAPPRPDRRAGQQRGRHQGSVDAADEA